MGAQMVREVASKTSDVAGDGTNTATILAQAIYREGVKAVTAGANPMAVKRGIDKAVEAEDFIGDAYRAASPEKRSAVGFVMTVYRRRLASSFEALKRTLNGRLMRAGGITEEDASAG